MVTPAIAVDARARSGVSQYRRRNSRSQEPAEAPNSDRSGSWVLPAPGGAYATLRAWSSAERWFDALLDVLASGAGEQARKSAKVARDTLLRVAYADRQAADPRTGRNLCTAHETVAAQLGMSSKTVQRSRDLLAVLGFAVTVVEGRYLTRSERELARAAHGGVQVRAASTRALVMPTAPPPTTQCVNLAAVENVHLPVSRRENRSTPVLKSSPTRASAREVAASRLQQRQKDPRSDRRETPRRLEVQLLAGRLSPLFPFLRDRHIGNVCDLLQRLGVTPERWTAASLKDCVDQFLRSTNRDSMAAGLPQDSLGYFAWMVRHAIANVEETPMERQLRERREGIERHRARAAEDAAARARAATMTDEEFYRIKADSDAQIVALRRVRSVRKDSSPLV